MIAIHYVKGSFIFDLIAIIPFAEIITMGNTASLPESSRIRLFRLLKLLRVARLVQLLDVERFKSVITDYFNNRLKEAVARGDDQVSYPILHSLLIIQFYKVVRLALVISMNSYFMGVIWYILVCDVLPRAAPDVSSFPTNYLNSCQKGS